jgi:hypothetical protein
MPNFPNSTLKRGASAVICDRCGFRYWDFQLKREWQGLMVCGTCWEPRHPQDLIRSKPDQRPRPYYRPEQTPQFVTYPSEDALTYDDGSTMTYDDGTEVTSG